MSKIMKSASCRVLKTLNNFICPHSINNYRTKPLLLVNQTNLSNFRSFKTGTTGASRGFNKVALGLGLAAVAGGCYEVFNSRKFTKPNPVLSREEVYDAIDGKDKPKLPENITPTKVVDGPFKEFDCVLTLFQYQSCPFCCKVRAFLEYYGIPYNLVEVHPVTKKALKWSDYRKVPLLLVAHGKDKVDVLRESSVIISILGSKMVDPSQDISTLLSYYKPADYTTESGEAVTQFVQKYFIMFGENGIPEFRTQTDLKNERQWRQWVDDELVHMISPNVYRTFSESLATFHHFSESGNWNSIFSSFEQKLAIYAGASVMYLIGKRLKSKYNLKDDVRESLYDSVNKILKEIPKTERYLGGHDPNLADLAAFGVLNSMKDCEAFNDMMANTKIKRWYKAVDEAVTEHRGYDLVAHDFKTVKFV